MNTVIYIYIYIYIEYFLVSWHFMTLEYCFRHFFAEVYNSPHALPNLKEKNARELL